MNMYNLWQTAGYTTLILCGINLGFALRDVRNINHRPCYVVQKQLVVKSSLASLCFNNLTTTAIFLGFSHMRHPGTSVSLLMISMHNLAIAYVIGTTL